MLKLKSFLLSEADKASEFMEQHPPFSTEKQSGIAYTVTHIVITYEDGLYNPKSIVSKWRTLINQEKEQIDLETHSIKRSQATIKEFAPKKYKENLSVHEIVKLCAEQDGVEMSQGRINYLVDMGKSDEAHQKQAVKSLTDEEIKIANRVNHIVLAGNALKQSLSHIEDCSKEIAGYEESIKAHEH